VNDGLATLDQKNMVGWVHGATSEQLWLFHVRVGLIAGRGHARERDAAIGTVDRGMHMAEVNIVDLGLICFEQDSES